MTDIGSQAECEKFPGRLRDLCEGRGLDGRPNPTRKAHEAFRAANGLPPKPAAKPWDVSQPSRGLGDVIKKITHATGINKVVEAVVGKKDCGCNKRAEQLNQMVPFGTQP